MYHSIMKSLWDENLPHQNQTLPWFSPDRLWTWSVDEDKMSKIETTDTEVIVHVAVPGVKEDEIDVSFEYNTLTVTVRSLSPTSFAQVQSAVYVAEAVNSSKAEATYENGVVTVVLPRVKKTSPTNKIPFKKK